MGRLEHKVFDVWWDWLDDVEEELAICMFEGELKWDDDDLAVRSLNSAQVVRDFFLDGDVDRERIIIEKTAKI